MNSREAFLIVMKMTIIKKINQLNHMKNGYLLLKFFNDCKEQRHEAIYE
jgi:hypothetical protein